MSPLPARSRTGRCGRALLIVTLTMLPAICCGQDTDQREWLQRLALRQRANHQAILTWTGEGQMSFESNSLEPGTLRQGRFTFAWDRVTQRQAYRMEWTRDPSAAIVHNGEVQGGLLTADWYLHAVPRPDVGQSDSSWQIEEARNFQFSLERPSFFPETLLFFGDRSPDEVWPLLDAVESPSDETLGAHPPDVSRESQRIKVTKSNPLNARVTTTWEFDLSQGGQLVRLENQGHRNHQVWEYSHVYLDGVWLPSRMEYRAFARSAQSLDAESNRGSESAPTPPTSTQPRPTIALIWEIQSQSLLPQDTAPRLEIESFGISSGDSIEDLRSGQVFLVGGTETTGTRLEPPGALRGQSPTGWRIWVVVAGWLLAVAGVVSWLRGTWLSGQRVHWSEFPAWVGLAAGLSIIVVGTLAWRQATDLHAAARLEAESIQSGHRCAYCLLRRMGIPLPMESVLKNLPRAVEPSLDELEQLVRDQGLHGVRRALAFEDREQIRVPAIIEVASPRQYLLADRSAHGDLLVFDLAAGRGLCDISTLATRWTTQLIEVQRDPEFLYKPARRDAVAPALQFETLDQDLGPLPPGNEILYRFRVRNAGRAPLEIAKAYPDCGCLRVEYPQAALMPGAQGEIVVVYDLRKRKVEGEFEHQIMVESNDPVLPYVRLTVYGNNKQRLSVAPSRVDFGAIPAGMSAHRQAVLTFHADDAIQGAIVEHSISDPRLRVQLRRIQGAEELVDLGIRDVTPKPPRLNRWLFDLQTGPQTATDEQLNAELLLTTNLANYPQVSIPVQGAMVAEVRAFPAKVSVAVGDEADPSHAVLWLVGAPARPFEVVEIRSPAASLQFNFQAGVPADRHRIEIEAMPENSSTPAKPGEFPCVATLRFADDTTSTVRWSATLVDWAPSN